MRLRNWEHWRPGISHEQATRPAAPYAGVTSDGRHLGQTARVSSPYAGVPPEDDYQFIRGVGCLPRTRGFTVGLGRAWMATLCLPKNGAIACLPRTRGFTVVGHTADVVHRVSSPYAGVHRSNQRCGHGNRRVFPVRGGSPALASYEAIGNRCLPRTRGFTSPHARGRSDRDVSSRTRGFTHHGPARGHDRYVSSPYAGVHRPSCS